MASIETAIESRKDSCTDFEAFRYILAVRLGDFHMEMNAVIKHLERLMINESSKDRMTLGYFAQKLVMSHLVSNIPAKIKKCGNYETNKQFLMTVGNEFLRDALHIFLKEDYVY